MPELNPSCCCCSATLDAKVQTNFSSSFLKARRPAFCVCLLFTIKKLHCKKKLWCLFVIYFFAQIIVCAMPVHIICRFTFVQRSFLYKKVNVAFQLRKPNKLLHSRLKKEKIMQIIICLRVVARFAQSQSLKSKSFEIIS